MERGRISLGMMLSGITRNREKNILKPSRYNEEKLNKLCN
jgi:hypothetical protein